MQPKYITVVTCNLYLVTHNKIIMQTALILFALGMPEIILIALVVLLLFGGKKIPELMRGIGKGVNQFKKGMNEVENEITFPDEKKEEKK